MNQDIYSKLTQLSSELFKDFASLIYNKTAINLKESKITMLSNRLRKRLIALDISSYEEYFSYISLAKNSAEIEFFLNAVTTNETYFFRNQLQLEIFVNHIIPEILKIKKNSTIRIWSAGCSTGEEPYNLAILLLEAMKKYGPFKFHIEANDLSTEVIQTAKEGIYWGRKIDKVPAPVLKRYFSRLDDKSSETRYQIRSDIKKNIHFYQANLFSDKAPTGLDIILCRNVMIYFDKEHQEQLSNIFYKSLNTPGYLFIGHSESLHVLNTPFIYKKKGKGSVYVKE